ncbi:MAG: alanine--tRNA ligase-related protein, partial [Vicinamibacterales bacterium]
GMGLERITAVMKGTLSNYDTKLFAPILRALSAMAGRTFRNTMDPADVSMRVVADHIRSTTFVIADGVVPSNEWRGYVLRKIMRRAMRHGRKLELTDPFLFKLVEVVVAEMGEAYPELKANRDSIVEIVRNEEERFGVVLTEGLPRLEDVLEQASRSGGTVPGEQAFKLYDTYGLPRDFIEDLATAQGLQIDDEGFKAAMERQRDTARGKSAFGGGDAAVWTTRDEAAADLQRADDFRGYEQTTVETHILELLEEDGKNRRPVDELKPGTTGYVALAATPFYLESGGQISDAGTIRSSSGEAKVTGVTKASALRRFHRIEVTRGSLKYRDRVSASVDAT